MIVALRSDTRAASSIIISVTSRFIYTTKATDLRYDNFARKMKCFKFPKYTLNQLWTL